MGSRVAERLGYRFLDTGSMYRAITCLALDRGIDLDDEDALAELVEGASVDVQPGPPEPARVLVNGNDVTQRLPSAEVGEAVSLVSRVPAVRDAMVSLQRKIGRQADTVMAGRDIGTVVVPDAPLKVYLEASPEERVRRRHEELLPKRPGVTLEEVRRELALRDTIDSGRAHSPLRPAEDAVIIDTDHLSLDQVVERILELVSCRS